MSTPSRRAQAATAAGLSALALSAYCATLLPGLDFGDTASFQAAGGSLDLTPRQAYPLYFALGNLVVWTTRAEPAWAMNLLSALCGALAVGATTWLVIDLTASVIAGAAAGLLLGSAYSFWAHAVIAEVYTLHLLVVSLVLIALVAWGRRADSTAWLTVVFALYGLGFGNHLMMILLAPGIVLYLTVRMPGGLRGLFTPRVIGVAVICAALGAAQYAWNFSWYWTTPDRPQTAGAMVSAFWFDVTKSDWRKTMVLGVHESALRNRVNLYAFLLGQQFGVAAVAVAVGGLLWLARRAWREASLLATVFAVSLAFAWTYNVGDAEVFFLPSHHLIAVFAGCGVAALLRLPRRFDARGQADSPSLRFATTLVAAAAVAYPAWRVVDTWPAVDRSGDDRPRRLLEQMAGDIVPEQAILVADVNWQLQNGLDYYARHLRPDLVHIRAADYLQTLPLIIRDNLAIDREVLLSPRSRQLLRTAYGDVFPSEPDARAGTRPLAARLDGLPRGLPYVLALLKAYPDVPLDAAELAGAIAFLTGGAATLPADAVYTIMVGRTGEAPVLVRQSARAFRTRLTLDGLAVDIRMESWLPADTMRRAGFGHVIVNRRHLLTLERGISVVVTGVDGAALRAEYASSLFAPQPRFRIRPPTRSEE